MEPSQEFLQVQNCTIQDLCRLGELEETTTISLHLSMSNGNQGKKEECHMEYILLPVMRS